MTLSSSPSSPQSAGLTVVLSGAALGCTSPEFQFWMRPPTGKWSVLQAFSSSSTASWHTAGLAVGTYELDAWARPSGSADKGISISRIAKYTLQAPTLCSSVTWNAPSPASPQSVGSKIGLSGTASGCASPLYQFWVQAPGAQWAILQAYSTTSSATWDTTGLVSGTYNLDIWVKNSGSTAAWETHLSPNPTYTLQSAAPCSSVTWNTPNPTAPQAPGTQITLGGVAGGCLNPQYQFWIQAPGGTWGIVQPYSSTSTFAWNTSGAATGTYLFDIYVKQLGSSASYEAHISPNPTYSLQTGAPCNAATLAFNPAVWVAGTSSVQLTATAAGCPSPTYQFWIQTPAGAWTILQAYSSSATATWATTGLGPGTYHFDVYVRQAGSTAGWEAHISPNPTYTLS